MHNTALNTLWLAAAAALLSAAPYARAEIYKWVDEHGVVQYSQQPPTSGQAEVVNAAAPPPADAEQDKALKSKMEAFDKRRAEQGKQAQEAAQKEQEQARLTEDCRKARAQLDVLKTHSRVRMKQGDDYRALSEEERQQNIHKLEQEIAEGCNGL